MEKRPLTDRTASGYDEGRTPASPQIAVFSDTGSPATNAGPATDRPDPASHDIYRRPANAIPFRRPPVTQPDEPAIGSPTAAIGSPTAAIGSPTAAIGSPTAAIGSPTAGGDRPTTAAGLNAEASTDVPLATSASAERNAERNYDPASYDGDGTGTFAGFAVPASAGSAAPVASQASPPSDAAPPAATEPAPDAAPSAATAPAPDAAPSAAAAPSSDAWEPSGGSGSSQTWASSGGPGSSDGWESAGGPGSSGTSPASADDLGPTGEYPVISDAWRTDPLDDTVVTATDAEPEYYPPFTLVDDLFFDDQGPDLPTNASAALTGPPAAESAKEGGLAMAGAAPAPGGKRSRLLGLRWSTVVAALVVLALAATGVAVAVFAAGADPLGRSASRSTAGGGPGNAGPAPGAPANAGPAPGAPANAGPAGSADGRTEDAPATADNPPAGRAGPAGSGSEQAGPATNPAAAHTVTAPRNGRDEASFDLVNGTTTVKLHTGDLGDDLFRVETPVGSEVLPRPVEQGDRVQLHLVDSGEDGPGSVDITLNSQVRWALRLTGGAAEHVVDMSEGELSGLEILGGATRVELNLPEPDGTLRVKMTGGVNEFAVGTPAGTPVRLRIGSGAAQVVLDGKTHRGIAPGRVFVPTRWGHADDRVELDAVAGVGTLTLIHH